MSDTVFANGLIVKTKENQPQWVLANLSFKVNDFTKFMNDNQSNGWVNVQLLKSKDGKPYAKLDNWKPSEEATRQPQPVEDNSESLPF
jgi:hypothetical protein